MQCEMKGTCLYRPPKGGGSWKVVFVELFVAGATGEHETPKQLRITGQEEEVGCGISIDECVYLDPTCSCFETNLGPHAFEVVTSKKILHFISESSNITLQWIAKLREVIATCKLDLDDVLLRSITERIDLDVEYDVQFLESKPLGVVLERSNESAIVKMSNFKESGVEAGSVLTKINGVPIVDQKYYEIIATLKHWRPPLHLSFIKCPTKSGFLKKFTKDKGRSGSKVWRNRYFSLESGHLQYREKEHTSTKGDIPLMGSSVSILAGPDIGERCCFRILSGVTAIILQAENHEVMMDWVTRLYHAIALANGAKYLPQLQANRAKSLAMQKEVEIATQASLKTATFEKDALKSPVKRPMEFTQSPSCVSEYKSFDEGNLGAGEIFVDNNDDDDEEEEEPTSYASLDEKESSSTDNSLEVNPSDIIFDERFMKSIDTIPLSDNMDIRNREIMDLLDNAIKLNFKAELIFAIHVAETYACSLHGDHEINGMYNEAKRVLDALLKAEQQESFGGNDDFPDVNFGIRHDISMDLSDEGIIIDKDSSVLECFSSSVNIDQNDSAVSADISYDNNYDDRNSLLDIFSSLDIKDDDVRQGDLSVEEKEAIKIATRSSRKYKFAANIPATVDDLKTVFKIFTNKMTYGESIKPIQLSTIWRLVTGEKGNLFKEMQLFSKFDVNNNGYLCEEDFVKGWYVIAKEMDSGAVSSEEKNGHELLRKLRSIAEEHEVDEN